MKNFDQNKSKKPTGKGNTKRGGNDERNYHQSATRTKTSYRDDHPQKRLADSANDVRWYSKDTELMKGAASISSLEPFGIRRPDYVTGLQTFNISGPDKGDLELQYKEDTSIFGSITTMYLAPTGCGQWKATDAINIAATHLYTYVRHANSGSKNYEKADLMMYCLAMAQIYSYCGWVSRILGTIGYYQKGNRDIPISLLTAMLGSISNAPAIAATAWDEIAQMRTWFNSFINKVNTLAVPNSLPLFERAYWMYSNIYTTTATWKKDIYFYSPAYFMFYHPTLLESGGALFPLSTEVDTLFSDGEATLFQLIQKIGDSLLLHVFGDDDMSIMSGDILKAYGSNNLFTIAQVPADYILVPTVDEEVILQFHNARIIDTNTANSVKEHGINFVPSDETGSSPTFKLQMAAIFQEDNLIKNYQISGYINNPSADITEFPRYGLPTRYTLDLPQDEFSPEVVTTSTRLTYSLQKEKPTILSNIFAGYVIHCDFWLPVGLTISRTEFDINGSPIYEELSLSSGNALNWEDITETDNSDLAMAFFNKEMPILSLVVGSTGWGTVADIDTYQSFEVPVAYTHRINATDNFVYVSDDTLDKINDVCILSELNIPHKY